jgi:glycosyltransferase involved in cell wall biosynthesis
MSIYYKEKAEYLNRAMQSIWDEQTVKPNEIVLVQDGKLTDELYEAINQWQEKLEEIFKTIALEKNVGLGDALNIGIKECKYELIARMDTDDICTPDRFEKQLKVFENNNMDICSSWVSEFDNDENQIISYRKVPEVFEEIKHFAKQRNPLNHPAVMYRKKAVDKAGGYKKMMWFEDYYLWIRMLLNDAKFYNIQEPLVNMRAGYGQLERRSGLKYALEEVKFQKELLSLGFLNIFEFIRNVSIRFTSRVIPKALVKKIYKVLRREDRFISPKIVKEP